MRRLVLVSLVASFFVVTEESAADTTLIPQPVKTTATTAYDDTKNFLSQHVNNPFYFGGSLGYGNTNWSEITTTPYEYPSNNEVAYSAPISATSGVFASGAFMGYQFSPHFMVEADYTHFDTTQVGFQTTADYGGGYTNTFDNYYGISSLNTETNAYSLLGKILVPFGSTKVYVYADAGVTYVQRVDESVVWDPQITTTTPFQLQDIGHFGPSFGFGLAYNITQHIFSEAAFQYTTGYGQANLLPAEDYIPFIYTLMFNLGIRV